MLRPNRVYRGKKKKIEWHLDQEFSLIHPEEHLGGRKGDPSHPCRHLCSLPALLRGSMCVDPNQVQINMCGGRNDGTRAKHAQMFFLFLPIKYYNSTHGIHIVVGAIYKQAVT